MLDELERYYDAVPRSSARVEQIGALTLFVHTAAAGWPYYARPTLGATQFAAGDVERVRARQRELGIPEAFEWVAETTPALADVIRAVGLAVVESPLMVLGVPVASAPPLASGVEVRTATLADDFRVLGAVAPLAFGAPGTAIGPVGVADVQALAARSDQARVALNRERVRKGHMVTVVALVDGDPVGIGFHQPVGSVTELVGIGVVPAFRRRGLGAAITGRLVHDAIDRGIHTVFLSAASATIARVYGRLGFARVGTACVAEA